MKHIVLAWKWLNTLSACGLSPCFGGEYSNRPIIETIGPALQFVGISLALCILLAGVLCFMSRQGGGQVLPVISTQAMVVVAWVAIVLGYPLLVVLLIRVVHDTTAFSFYMKLAHRQESSCPGGNVVYAALGLHGGAVAHAIVPLSVALTACIGSLLPSQVPLVITLTHYVFEHWAWRSTGPMRQALNGELAGLIGPLPALLRPLLLAPAQPSPFQAQVEISPGKGRTPSSHIRRIYAASP